MKAVRFISLLLALPLLVACAKVTDSEPSELAAGARSELPAGGAGMSSGGSAGGSEVPIVVDGGTARPHVRTAPSEPAADGGAKDEDAGTSSNEPLCDGSGAMRLSYKAFGGGGFGYPASFTDPHGFAYFVIDGKCRYRAATDFMRGIFTGTLTAAQADQLSADLDWNELDGWTSYATDRNDCFDGNSASVMKNKAATGCSCGCDPEAPKGLGDALTKAHTWVDKLIAVGEPLDGPVSAAMVGPNDTGPQPIEFEWSLSRSIESIPNLLFTSESNSLPHVGPWATFDDAADYTKLREMRSETVRLDPSGRGDSGQKVRVRANGQMYLLFVRDDLPAGVENAWSEMKASVPSTSSAWVGP